MTEKKEIERRIVSGKNLSIETRQAENGDTVSVICGYSAVYNSWSDTLGWFREKIEPGAFNNALSRFDTRGLYNHDSNYVLGRKSAGTLLLRSDEKGLWMEIIPPKTSYADDLIVSINRKDIREQSFGFTVISDKWEKLDEDISERTLLEIGELFDVGPVTFPAYPDTTIAARSMEKAKSLTSQRSSGESRKRALLNIDKRFFDINNK